jgi:hypothetical protein
MGRKVAGQLCPISKDVCARVSELIAKESPGGGGEREEIS